MVPPRPLVHRRSRRHTGLIMVAEGGRGDTETETESEREKGGQGLTRALEGGLRITPSGGGGGAYNAPPSISAPMRASATNFGGYLGPY